MSNHEPDIEQTEKEKVKLIPTFIPDHSFVISQISLIPQHVQIEYAELNPYFDWIKDQAEKVKGIDLVNKGISMTVNNLEPEDNKWNKIVEDEQDDKYTMKDCIEQKAISCFHRAVFFNLLMQQAGVAVTTQEGIWIESERPDLHQMPEKLNGAKIDEDLKPLFLSEDDSSEGHLWNLTQSGDEFYLIDTSLYIDEEDKSKPVVHQIRSFKQNKKYFTIPLPDGRFRHYISDGTVRTKSNSNTNE